MKISCTQENLNKGLNLVSHIASKDVNLPVLSNVLLKISDKVLKISATNLEVGITSLVRGKVDEEGEFMAQAKIITDYIGLLPQDKVELATFKDTLQIVCGNYNTQIKGSVVEEFPIIPTVAKKGGYQVALPKFKEAIQQVVFAAILSDLRPEISGLYCSFKDQKLTLAATDSYRLAETVLDFKFLETENQKNQTVIIPLRTAQEILRVLGNANDALISEDNNFVDIYIEDNQILLVINNTEIVSKLIEGQYPDYKQIIPQDFKTNIVVDKRELQKAVKATSLFAKSGAYDVLLKINTEKGEMELFAENSQLGKNSVKISTQVSGESNEIVLNYRYLLDGLQNVLTDQLAIDIVDNTSPCVVRPYQKDQVLSGFLYLIMPIRQ